MNLKQASRAFWPALALAGLMACLSGGDGEPGDSEWYGVIRNTCGPADGPAVSIRIEEQPVASCGDTTRPDTAMGLYLLYVDGLPVDSLKPGTVLKDTVGGPIGLGFGSILTLTVEKADEAAVNGRLIVETLADRSPSTFKRGKVKLKVCPRQMGFCG